MNRIVLSAVIGLLSCAAAFAQDQPDKVWSINFAETGYTTDAGTDPNGIVPDTNWFNCTLKTGSDTVDGLSLSWSSANTWRYTNKTFTLMKAYIDDGGSRAQVNVTLKTTFAEGAMVSVDLGTNTKFPERKVLSWDEPPTAVKFVPIRFGRREGRLVSKSDGLYFYTGIAILLR